MAIRADEPLTQTDGEVPPSLDGIDMVHELLNRYWSTIEGALSQVPDRHWRALFDSSVTEIATNIIRHGYPAGSLQIPFSLSLRCFPDRMEAVLIDRGLEFDFPLSIRPVDMRVSVDSADLDRGWGLPIVQAAADRIHYEHLSSGMNRWHIEKRLPS